MRHRNNKSRLALKRLYLYLRLRHLLQKMGALVRFEALLPIKRLQLLCRLHRLIPVFWVSLALFMALMVYQSRTPEKSEQSTKYLVSESQLTGIAEQTQSVPKSASLPVYAAKYVNGIDYMYSTSGVNITTNASGSKATIEANSLSLYKSYYFDTAYLAQYISGDKRGMLNVYCELTSEGGAYVYDLYTYKGSGISREPETDLERKLWNQIIMQYTGDCFDTVSLCDISYGSDNLSDKDAEIALIEFIGRRNNTESVNFALVTLDNLEVRLL